MPDPQYQVVVVGAGISGLVCAWQLAKSGVRTALVEASDHVGGVMLSEHVDGYLLERGPNSFINSPAAMQIVNELGLAPRAQLQPLATQDRYVWRAGKLHKVPTGPAQMVGSQLLSVREKFQMLHGLVGKFPPPVRDMTLGAYARQRIGNGAVEALLKPGIAGIYAADPDNISLAATLPKLYPALTRHARILDVAKELKSQRKTSAPTKPNTPKSLVSFDAGIEQICKTLAEQFTAAGGELLLNYRAKQLQPGPVFNVKAWTLTPEYGEPVTADHIILSLPAHACAQVLSVLAPQTADTLQQLEYAPMVVAHVGIREDQLREHRPGFGFLTARNQGVRALGAIWSDRVFPGRAPTGHRLLTMFYSGEIDPTAFTLTDDQLREQVIADLRSTMGLHSAELPLFRVTRWKHAIPIMRVGHLDRMETAIKQLPTGVELLGSYTGGVSIPDRMERATEAAHRLAPRFTAERANAAA